MKPANKVAAAMDAHLEAHPPNIVWGKAVKGVRHHESIEEIPLPKPGAKKAPKPEESLRPFELTLDEDDLT